MPDTRSDVLLPEHVTIKPSVLYFGTPVVLVTTRNPDGGTNITPMSSAWALGDKVVLGLGMTGQGAQNLQRDSECVLNFPSEALQPNVERIARATGCNPVPEAKARMGYAHVADKFALGGFTAVTSEMVGPPRIVECPLQFEAKTVAFHHAHGGEGSGHLSDLAIVETEVLRVHAHRGIVVSGTSHIDTARWKPLFYMFRRYFGPGPDLGRNFRAEA